MTIFRRKMLQTSKSQPNTPHTPSSRIPIPSPTTLRRAGSLRVKAERDSVDTNHSPFYNPQGFSTSRVANQRVQSSNQRQGGLRRGGSFSGTSDSGALFNGVKSAGVAPRPQYLNIESRAKGPLKGGPNNTESPSRTRSLVIIFYLN